MTIGPALLQCFLQSFPIPFRKWIYRSGVLGLTIFIVACDNGPIPRNGPNECVAPAQVVQDDVSAQLVDAFPELPGLANMVGLVQIPGDDSRWFAILKEGRVMMFDNSPGADSVTEVLDISDQVRDSGEMGFHSIAFHPNFASNQQLYLSYNESTTRDSIISRVTFDGVNPVDTATETTLLRLSQPASNHNGGQIAFGPDGMLYIGFGDGGGSGDTFGNGQNLQSWHGSLLRIDVDSGSPYSVPADNPFVGNPDALPEIYAYGLRNPWRFSFDQQTGELWVADVGQNRYEEINLVSKGDNLGWPIMEATSCYNSSSCDQTGLTLPVAEYAHGDGDCSVSGGFVYRGESQSVLAGSYLYSDFCSGRLRSTRRSGESYITQLLTPTNINTAGFGQGLDGEVYYLGWGGSGRIYRIEAQSDGEVSTIPESLSETGCFQDASTKEVSEHVVPFAVTSQLWSDGAEKSRFLSIPENRKIILLDDGDYEFPVGTVLVKNFTHQGQYLETRLMMRHETGWGGYSYEWSADQTDAALVDEGKTIDAGDFVHTIPSRSECFQCHTSAANVSLGPEASQLDTTYSYPSGQEGNQNMSLFKANYLDRIPDSSHLTPMAALDDETADTVLKARSYLHANCSGCHRPGGPSSGIDLRIQTALAATGACDQPPASGDLDIINPRIIAPGDPQRSVLLARLQTLDEARMPPVASLRVHDEAVAVISDWIAQMSDCTGD